eukprot:c31292_g1_i1 orf=92-346(+)
MLRRKTGRIAHRADSGEAAIDNKLQEERWSIFTNLQSSGSYRREAQRRVSGRRIPGIKMRARMLLKKVKETCGRFLSCKVLCKR